MVFSRQQLLIAALNLAYIVPATLYFVANGNYEFVLYVAQMVFILGLTAFTIHRSQFPNSILWGLSAWGLMHVAGGGVKVGESVLYAMPIWRIAEVGDTYVFKYDQLVHAFGFFMATLVLFHLLTRLKLPEESYRGAAWIAAFGGMGLGAVNEIIEFIPVLLLPETGVGGYYNTALDLCANALGATLAGVMLVVRARMKRAPPAAVA